MKEIAVMLAQKKQKESSCALFERSCIGLNSSRPTHLFAAGKKYSFHFKGFFDRFVCKCDGWASVTNLLPKHSTLVASISFWNCTSFPPSSCNTRWACHLRVSFPSFSFSPMPATAISQCDCSQTISLVRQCHTQIAPEKLPVTPSFHPSHIFNVFLPPAS